MEVEHTGKRQPTTAFEAMQARIKARRDAEKKALVEDNCLDLLYERFPRREAREALARWD